MKSLFRLTLLASVLLLAFGSASAKMKKPVQASPKPTAATEVDDALSEFKAAAERLGKSMAKAADEDTAEARAKILKTMNGAIRELSRSMNRASEHFEANHAPSPSPGPGTH